MTLRRAAATIACATVLGLTGASCAGSGDDSGTARDLEQLRSQVAKLRLEVDQLREEVAGLRDEVLLLTPATDPDTGLSVVDDTTTTSAPAG